VGRRDLEDKPEGKRPLGRSRRRWYVIKMELKEIGSGLDLSATMQGQVARSYGNSCHLKSEDFHG
jgi:hypothetical protein